jgi:ribosomal-protein-alanine N-acetyltransferase
VGKSCFKDFRHNAKECFMTVRDRLPETIETTRLVLRPPRLSDVDDLVAEANNWKVLEPTASLPYPYEAEHGRAFVGKSERASQHPYVIADKASDRLRGVIGLYFHPDQPTELGYWLGERHWGQGFAPEAVRGILDATTALGLTPIRARVLAANAGSIRVLEKTGFVVIEETLSVVERHRGKPLLVLEWRG